MYDLLLRARRFVVTRIARRRPSDLQAFPNLLSARNEILDEINLAARGARHLRLTMMGGRIRTMSDIVKEAIRNISELPDSSDSLDIEMQCIAPDYLEQLTLPGRVDNDAQRARNIEYADLVRDYSEELKRLCAQPDIVAASCDFKITYYRTIPLIYCFIVGDSVVVWGFFTWDPDLADFKGPENPCFLLRRGDPWFAPTRNWLLNRVALNEQQDWQYPAPDI